MVSEDNTLIQVDIKEKRGEGYKISLSRLFGLMKDLNLIRKRLKEKANVVL